MAFDAHKNFAYSSVATAPSPATSGTSLTVATGDGTKFPAAPFNATVWPAGAVPSGANAEIVRVTAKAGDVLTITRAQEGSTARSIVIGDQIANTITAKLLTDLEAAVSPGIIYVAAPTGVAATDTAAIQAAHDALPSEGGELVLCPESYAINPASPLTLSKPIHLRGAGGFREGNNPQTTLTFDSATATAITITSPNVILEDFYLVNTHATAPTAGAGIAVTGTGSNGIQYRSVSVRGFYINWDIQYGFAWRMHGCHSLDFVLAGVKVQNLDNADQGDSSISDSYIIAGPTNTPTNAIGVAWYSSGGLRLTNNKWNSSIAGGSAGTKAILIEIADGAVTSDILITGGNSIENYQYGVYVDQGASHTGSLGRIIITDNEFSCPTACVELNPAATAHIAHIIITDNIIGDAANGIVLGNVDDITYGPNLFTNCTNNVLINAGVTNSRLFGLAKIFDQTLASDTASIDTGANGIPAGFSRLLIVFVGRSTSAAATEAVTLRFNNDSGNNYLWEQLLGAVAVASAAQQAATSSLQLGISAATETANYATVVEISVPAYDQTSFFKSGIAMIARGLASTSAAVAPRAFSWLSTAAITRVAITSAATLKAGSRLIIYGMP